MIVDDCLCLCLCLCPFLCAHLDDRLPQEVVGLPGQLLPEPRLEVVVLVPDSHFDPVRGVVTLAAVVTVGQQEIWIRHNFEFQQIMIIRGNLQLELFIPLWVELLRNCLGSSLSLPNLAS